MNTHDSILTHHLRYRLWIAELNFYINVLRIFDESLESRSGDKNKNQLRKKVDFFRKGFIEIRTDIDDLRHEMHLVKMKLAAFSRQAEPEIDEQEQAATDQLIRKRFTALQKKFHSLKEAFILFEDPEKD